MRRLWEFTARRSIHHKEEKAADMRRLSVCVLSSLFVGWSPATFFSLDSSSPH